MPLPDGAREGLHIVEYEDGTRIEVDRKEHVVEIKDSYGSYIRMADGDILIQATRELLFNDAT